MKVVISNSAQKGNMLNIEKKTLVSEKKNGKEQTSGKKLVQARLPFKILVGTTPPTLDGCVPPAKTEVPPKKRKLSYTEDSDNPKKIAVENEEVIVLDEEQSKEIPHILSPVTPIAKPKNKSNKSTPRSAGSSTTPKVLIKLPLSGKKKRKSKRSAQQAKCEVSDSSDVELVSDGQQNRHKKVKLAEHTQQYSEDVNKCNELKTNSPNKEGRGMCNFELTLKEDFSSKEENETVTKELLKSSVMKKSKTQEIGDHDGASEDDPKIPETCEKEKSSPNKDKSMNRTLPSDNDKANNSKCDPAETATPISGKGYSRRSTRKSEADQRKKEKNQVSEELSSEPEIVSEKSSAVDTSINSELRKKLLTPKQLKLMEQRKKLRDEKELKLQQLKEEKDRKLQEQREERERKVQEEKIQKQKEREEKELQRKKEREEKDEQKRREKEEKEEQRRKDKEDKERKRLAEIEAKNEEKRKKDEAKEEERRKKEEDRRRKELEKEEEENKKKKAAQAFTKFFVPKAAKPSAEDDQESRDDAESVDSLAFRPFQVKGDMKLAPLVRREFRERSREKLDSFLKGIQTEETALYINELKSGKYVPLRGSKTVLKDSDYDDVILIENELETAAQPIDEPRPKPIQKYKAKYYFFRENRRPPFYGTWRKKSTVITSRRPFAIDKKFFDYEVDSDDEWEEEEPGESLNGSEDEKDESEDEDYEVDNEWFVPHGHLSDEELQNEDELGPDTSREAQKAKLKALQQEFAQEMKKKTEKIKPRLIGTIWEDENGNRPNFCPTIIWDSLCIRAMMFCKPPLVEEQETIETESTTPPPEKPKRLEINDELMGDLVRLVHGNRHSRVFLIKEYMEHVSNTCDTIKNGECLAPTKSQIRERIDEISEWSVVDATSTKKKNKKKLCWVVSADILDKYSLGKLGLRNEWSYKLQPKFDKDDKNDPIALNGTQEDTTKAEISETPKLSEQEKKKTTNSGITKFAKVLTKEEKHKQLKSSRPAVASGSPKNTEKSYSKIKKPKASPKVKTTQKPDRPIVEKSLLPSPSTPPLLKKRVAILMSVPPGQQFSLQSKNTLISNFLQKNKTTSTSSAEIESTAPVTIMHVDVDESVVLD